MPRLSTPKPGPRRAGATPISRPREWLIAIAILIGGVPVGIGAIWLAYWLTEGP